MSANMVYKFATPYDPKATVLYVNIVPRYFCTNSCRFCSRKDAIQGRPNIYEKKAGTNLWLPKAPMFEDVVRDLEVRRTVETTEIAFVGLGEPLLQFELVRNIITSIGTDGFQGKVRIDTNGLVKCWRKNDPAQELQKAGLDEIRISVNAVGSDEYTSISRPKQRDAFEKLCEFVRDCIKNGIDTYLSFVVGFDDGEVKTRTAEEYQKFARILGVQEKNVIIRQYVPPLEQNLRS